MEQVSQFNVIEHPIGDLKSPKDSRDWVFENLAHGHEKKYISEFPEEYDLREHTQPSRDQGTRGTCAAFTACTIKEIHENREDGFDEWMSPEFIYFHRDNKPASGMYGRNVFKIMQRVGSVPESHFPYQREDSRLRKPSDQLYQHAAKYKIANYARVKTADGLKKAILELGPGYLLMPLFKNRPEFWIAQDGEKNNGGHATTVVGYTKTGFILKNSWGVDWNDAGCIIMPFSAWKLHWECWVPINQSRQGEEIGIQPIMLDDNIGNSVNEVDIEPGSELGTVPTPQLNPVDEFITKLAEGTSEPLDNVIDIDCPQSVKTRKNRSCCTLL
jgi:C1A family cysteine protease